MIMKKLIGLVSMVVMLAVSVSPVWARESVDVYARVWAGIAPPRVTSISPRDEVFMAGDSVQEFEIKVSQSLEDGQSSTVYYNIDTYHGSLSHSQGKFDLEDGEDGESVDFAYQTPDSIDDGDDPSEGPYDQITITLNDMYNFTSREITIYVY